MTLKSRPKGRLSKQFSAYFRSYVRGDAVEDDHVPLFRALQAELTIKKILYPGCHRHITPSLFFSDVHYVDADKRVAGLYSDPKALAYIKQHKTYPEPSNIKFSCKDFTTELGLESSVDLLISLSAGIVSRPCCHYLKLGGHLLVNDSHYDARTTFLNKQFKLVAVFNDVTKSFDQDAKVLAEHFHTRDGKPITVAMAEESLVKPRGKRSFKLKVESRFYLFKKVKPIKKRKRDHEEVLPRVSKFRCT